MGDDRLAAASLAVVISGEQIVRRKMADHGQAPIYGLRRKTPGLHRINPAEDDSEMAVRWWRVSQTFG